MVFWVVVGIFFGLLYSAPLFKLRQTLWKPVANFTVGTVPVLIVAAFAGATHLNALVIVAVKGTTTAVNSLWEDLADYVPDLKSGARTIHIVLGPHKWMLLTKKLGYALIQLMLQWSNVQPSDYFLHYPISDRCIRFPAPLVEPEDTESQDIIRLIE